MPSVSTHGHSMHYIEHHGVEPPILMIHSSGLDGRQWNKLSRLVQGRRVIQVDLVGYGKSSPWTGGESFEWLVDAEGLEAVLALYDGPWDLVGHSYGGLLALKLALRNPGRVRRLSLHEPVVWGVLGSEEGNSEAAAAFQATVGGLFGTENPKSDAEWMAFFVDFWNGPGLWESLPDSRKAGWIALADKVIPEVRSICFDPTPASDWAKIDVPTLVTVGRDSPFLERAALEVLETCMPDVRLVTTAGGHMGPLCRSLRYALGTSANVLRSRRIGRLMQLIKQHRGGGAPPVLLN